MYNNNKMKVDIKRSTRDDKRMMAIFTDKDGSKTKTHFGYRDDKTGKKGSTYIDHKDETKKINYKKRHQVNEDFTKYKSAGSLSYHILWTEKNLDDAVRKYKKKFNLS